MAHRRAEAESPAMIRYRSLIALPAAAMLGAAALHASAQPPGIRSPSDASALSLEVSLYAGATASLVPLVASVQAARSLPLVVRAVEQSVDAGSRWIVLTLEDTRNASRHTVRLMMRTLGPTAVALGDVVTATAVNGGVLLSHAGRSITLIADATGARLMHDERLTERGADWP